MTWTDTVREALRESQQRKNPNPQIVKPVEGAIPPAPLLPPKTPTLKQEDIPTLSAYEAAREYAAARGVTPPPKPPSIDFAPQLPPLAREEDVQAGYEQALTDAQEKASVYFGPQFSPGPQFRDVFEAQVQAFTDEDLRPRIIQDVERSDPRTLVQGVASTVWSALTPVEQDQFVSQVALISGRLAETSGNTEPNVIFQTSIGQAEGGRQMFTRMLDYVVRHPDSPLTDIYRGYGLLDTVQPVEPPAPARASPWNVGGWGVGSAQYNERRRAERASRDLVVALTNQLADPDLPPSTGNILNQDVVGRIIPGVLAEWDGSLRQAKARIDERLQAVRDTEGGKDLVVTRLNSSEFVAIYSRFPDTKGLSVDTLMQAMAISQKDLDELKLKMNPVWNPQAGDFTRGETRAELHWRNLGLNDVQINALRQIVLEGIDHDLPDYVARSVREADNRRVSEQALKDWVNNNPGEDIPYNVYGDQPYHVSEDYLRSIGQTNEHSRNLYGHYDSADNDILGSVIEHTVGAAADLASSVWGGFVDADEAYLRDQARMAFEDPNRQVDFSFSPDVRERQDRGWGGDSSSGLIDPVANMVLKATESLLNLPMKVGINTSVVTEPTFNYLEAVTALGEWGQTPGEAGTWLEEQKAPDSRRDGRIRRELNSIYEGASPEGRRAMQDVYPSLFRYDLNSQGKFELTTADNFIKNVRQGASVEEAAAAAASILDVVAYSVLGTTNVFAVPGVGGVWKNTVVNGIRASFRVPRYAFPEVIARTLRAGERGTMDTLTRGALMTRREELAGRIARGVVLDPATGTEVVADAARLANSGLGDTIVIAVDRIHGQPLGTRITSQYHDEIGEIDRLLEQADGTTFRARTDVRPASGRLVDTPEALYTGKGLIDLFTMYRPLTNMAKPLTSFTRKIGDVAPSPTTFRERAYGALRTVTMTGRRTPGGRYADVAADTLSVENVVKDTLVSLSRVDDLKALSTAERVKFARLALTELQKAGTSREAALNFFTGRGIYFVAPSEGWRAADLLTDINIDDLVTFADDVVIASDPAEYSRLLKEAVDPNKVFKSQSTWATRVVDELTTSIEQAVLKRYGLPTDDPAGWLKLQRRLNSLMSSIFLENPGYVIRNWMSNVAAATLDSGFVDGVWRTGFRPGSAFDEVADVAGILPAERGFGVEAVNEVNAARVSAREALTAGGIRGGSPMPFIFGGLPHLHFRRFAGYIEGTHRAAIESRAFLRHFNRIWASNPTARTRLLNQFPQVKALLEQYPEVARLIDDALINPDILDVKDLVRIVKRQRATEEFIAVAELSVDEILRSVGLSTSIDPLAKSQLRGILLGSSDDALRTQTIERYSEMLRRAGQQMNMPTQVTNALIDVHTMVYRKALEGGLDGRTALNLATESMVVAEQAMVPLVDRAQLLRDMLVDPEYYRRAVYGFVENLDIDAADEIVSLVGGGTKKREVLDHLTEVENYLEWERLDDLIMRAVDPSNPFQDTELVERAGRALETLHQVRLETSRRISLGTRRATDAVDALSWIGPTDWTTLQGMDLVRARRQLDNFVTDLAARTADDFPFVWSNGNSRLRKMLPGVPADELKRAVDDAISRGHLRRHFIFPPEGDLDIRTRYSGLTPVSVEEGDILSLPPGAKEVAPRRATQGGRTEAQFRHLFDEFADDVRFIATRMAEQEVEAARPAINNFLRELDSGVDNLMGNLVSGMVHHLDPDALRMVPHATPSDAALMGADYFAYAKNASRTFYDRYAEQFNQLNQALYLDPMVYGDDVWRQAEIAKMYPPDGTPSSWDAAMARYAPVISTLEMLSETALRQYTTVRGDFLRVANSISREAAQLSDGNFVDLTTENALRWAEQLPTEAADSRGFTEPLFTRPGARTAEIPTDSELVFPAQIDGRTFLEAAPEGYKAGIAPGGWAVFVRADATADNIRDVTEQLSRSHRQVAAAVRNGNERVLEMSRQVYNKYGRPWTDARKGQNPLGFRAAALSEKPDFVLSELAPYVAKAKAGDKNALMTVKFAVFQRMSGWPISATVANTPLENVYRAFVNGTTSAVQAEARAFRPVGTGQTARQFALTAEQAQEFERFIDAATTARNNARAVSFRMADATADWVLHNYNNTWDIDYLLRWIAPWHIWPTRTAAKIAVRVAENPRLLTQWKRFTDALEQANEELPGWMQDDVPADWLLGPFGTLGLIQGDNSITVDPAAFFFWQDLLQPFEIGESEEHTRLGRYLQTASDGVVAPSPIVTLVAALTGQFGGRGRQQVVDQFIESNVKPTDNVLYAAGLAARGLDLPFEIPRNVYLTQREINEIETQYAIAIFDATNKYGADSDEVKALVEASTQWARTDRLGVTEQVLDGIFSSGAARNPVHEAVSRSVFERRQLPRFTSYLGGTRVNISYKDRQKFFDWLSEMQEVFSREYSTTRERSNAIAEVYDHPAFSTYFQIVNNEGSINERKQAEAVWFKGLSDHRGAMEAALRQTDPDDYATIARIVNDKFEADRRLARELLSEYGINFISDEEFTIEFNLSPQQTDLLGNYVMSLPEDKLPFLHELFKRDIDEISDLSVEEVRAAQEEGIFPSVDNITEHYISSWLSAQATQYLAAISARPDYLIDKNGVPTNALDYEEWAKNKELVERTWPGGQEELQLIKLFLNRGKTPSQTVDTVLEDLVQERSQAYFDVLAQDLEVGARADALDQVFKSYKPPTVDEVMREVEEQFGEFWFDQSGVSRDDLRALVRERLANADSYLDLSVYLDGNWNRRADRLQEDFNTLLTLSGQDAADFSERVRHFRTPSGEVVTTQEELDEFRAALDEWKTINRVRDNGVEFFPTPTDFPNYFKYFQKGGEQAIALEKIIQTLLEGDSEDRDFAFQLIDARDEILGRNNPKADVTYDANGNPIPSSRGIPTNGTAVTKLGGRYTLIPPQRTLSREGEITKAYLNSEYFYGSFAENALSDFAYETLARNQVSSPEEITDFFHAIYKQIAKSHEQSLLLNDDVQTLLLALDDETTNNRVPTYRYLRGIQGLLDVVYGRVSAKYTNVSFVPTFTKMSATSPKRATPRSSGNGPGGLPTWSDVERHINTVFQDKEFVNALARYFSRQTNTLSKNHQRMLRFMYKTFPMNIDLTYDEWFSALKLVFQTNTVFGNRNLNAPVSRGVDEAPRLAKFARS